MGQLASILNSFRNFLFSKTNKEFLIFLFFLVLSGIFWLMTTLNQSYEKEVVIPIRIANVPSDVMLTSEETDTIHVNIHDKGMLLLAYTFSDELKNVTANFRHYDQGGGNGTISNAELNKLVKQYLSNSAKINSIKPEKLKFYYNTGAHKRVPVRWRGRVIPEDLYYLSNVSYSPDSVTIYASEEKLDSIRMVYSEPLNKVGFRDSLIVDSRLQRMEGVKMVPDRVTITFATDVLTEESIDNIPVKAINMPEGKVLRTFPAKVSVKFVTGINVYRTLTAKDFTVVADYNDIMKRKSDKCNLFLQQTPQGITRASLVTKQVDYLIEER
jgi:YbbR domain-containing protein